MAVLTVVMILIIRLFDGLIMVIFHWEISNSNFRPKRMLVLLGGYKGVFEEICLLLRGLFGGEATSVESNGKKGEKFVINFSIF